jgi:hypothetical protein
MERNGRLAGARTSLDDNDALERSADDLVLLALDRLDDVAHASGAFAAQSVEQGCFPDEDEVVRPVV